MSHDKSVLIKKSLKLSLKLKNTVSYLPSNLHKYSSYYRCFNKHLLIQSMGPSVHLEAINSTECIVRRK